MNRPKLITETRITVPTHLEEINAVARFVVYEPDADHEGGGYLEVTTGWMNYDGWPRDCSTFRADSTKEAAQILDNLDVGAIL